MQAVPGTAAPLSAAPALPLVSCAWHRRLVPPPLVPPYLPVVGWGEGGGWGQPAWGGWGEAWGTDPSESGNLDELPVPPPYVSPFTLSPSLSQSAPSDSAPTRTLDDGENVERTWAAIAVKQGSVDAERIEPDEVHAAWARFFSQPPARPHEVKAFTSWQEYTERWSAST
ncbi:hypothetical protein DFH06DRAFT_1337473 [Mycena polygramma]|nr:hypothetical protein DFH06DRAFT_1337473 [Mycena polygramma]